MEFSNKQPLISEKLYRSLNYSVHPNCILQRKDSKKQGKGEEYAKVGGGSKRKKARCVSRELKWKEEGTSQYQKTAIEYNIIIS